MITNISEILHLSDALFRAIRDRIVLGEYPPGQILSEKELCHEFSVSRTPFREAIRKLEELKLVKVVPRFGSYVAEIDIHEVKSAYEVRRPLEILAARLAAQRRTSLQIKEMGALVIDAEALLDNPDSDLRSNLDRRYHQIIREASRNPVLVETLNNLHLICSRIWNSLQKDSFPAAEVIDGLTVSLNALIQQDEDTLARMMDLHMQETHESLKNQIF